MKVMFRVDKRKPCDVFAIFPYDFATSNGYVTTYEHIGQHSSGSYYFMIQNSRPATEDEYGPLLNELRKVGYEDLKVIKRYQRGRK